MKFLRLLFVSLICWPLGLAVEAVFLVLAVPANLIGLFNLRPGSGWEYVPELNRRIRFNVYRFPRWLWIFDNDEDGPQGPYVGRNPSEIRWCMKAARWPLWRRILSWNLLRNPVSNLRFTCWGVYVNPWFVEWIGNSPNPARDFGGINMTWCWARQGWRSGLWIVRAGKDGRSVTHRLGWGVHPQPLREIDRWQGFRLQIWRRS